MNDDEVLTTVRESLGDTRMRHDLQKVVARGRTLRRRRRAVPAVAAIGVTGAVLATVLPGSGEGTAHAKPPAATHHGPSSASSQAVNIDLAAWSVHTKADSSVELTMREMFDADRLRAVLAQAKVRADIQFVTVPAGQLFTGCKGDFGPDHLAIGTVVRQDVRIGHPFRMFVYPKLMPAGSVLSIVFFGNGTRVQGNAMDLYSKDPGKCVPQFAPDWKP